MPMEPQGALAPGSTVGRYRILGLLGFGGMGEVYRAHDPQLGREVAVKVLRPGLLSEAQLRLFEQEARAAAALNHPSLVAIYDALAGPSGPFIVYELLEGESLRDRLKPGALSVPQAVEYAIQIAEGLSAAHAKGIVHRDLKPENVFITADDRAKILDFGLAQLQRAPSRPLTAQSGPGATASLAETGVVGTLGYMSPEQVSGGPVDHRSDIFSFGVLLYEMLSGRPAFSGPVAPLVMTAILVQEPTPLPARLIPLPLVRIVQRCLAKRPDDRFPSASDLARALRAAGGERRPSRWSWTTAAGALTLAAALLLASWHARPPSTPAAAPASVTNEVPEVAPLTGNPGREGQPALSRDGRRVAFIWDGGKGRFDLYTRDLDTGASQRLTDGEDAECCPAWSPDGQSIAFLRLHRGQADLLTVPALGGAERRLRSVHPWFGSGLDWSPDGRALAYSDREGEDGPFQLFLLPLEGGPPRALTHPAAPLAGDGLPVFSPSGTEVAFVRLPGLGQVFKWTEVATVPAAGGEPRQVLREATMVGGLDWTPDAREIVYSSARGASMVRLWRVDLRGGAPRPLNEDPPVSTLVGAESLDQVTRSFRVSVARRGDRVAYTHRQYDTDLVEIDLRSPRAPARPLQSSARMDEAPQYSPDGARIAFASDRASSTEQIWVCETRGTACSQVTALPVACGTPRWSPDGQRLAFDAAPEGKDGVYVADVGTRVVRRLTTPPSVDEVPSWSSDGRFLYFASDRGGSWQVWKMPAEGGAAQQVTRKGGFAAFESRDGRTLYYTMADRDGLYQRTADGTESRVLDLPECWGYWAVGSRGLYVVDSLARGGPMLNLFSFATRRLEPLAALPEGVACGESGLAVSRDERFLAYEVARRGSNVMVIRRPR